ncbi:cyclopropane-fatty-acyl-phospholipid synthase family protein [Aeromicrobium sp.]|uniref:SAM-dependent methyltransferase n=1 Tax=Aeromicrobium sp. TaxID=1871063 RepID=UPI0019A27A83|nr:cyclopropane-fatty-acyl-phospholipid synthase family protein [Aeromicrobium sp.]MBC7632883.1 class I SAM-dependent methyltransferase [Aeromicrobium sp.]
MTQIATTRWSGIAHAPRTPTKARVAKAILKPTVNRVPVRLTFANGTTWGAGGPDSPEMRLVRPKAFFARLGADTKIGFGEAYMAGDWTAGHGTDLADLLTPFAERLTSIVPEPLQRFRGFVDTKLPHHQRNSLDGSRQNIEAHYDLSNDLFTQFLDPTMSYSAAWFEDDNQDLESAQLRKIDAILDDAHVGEGTRVLEIGSGWGALAIRAAKRGAKVTTITISKEQAALAEEKFAEAGVDVDLQLVDYREVRGEYDAIVSVEMIEAVGEEYWPTYFATIDKLLAPGGHVSIQAITMEHHRYLATRNSYGWIQKYIFPGGLIPSLQAVDDTLAEHTTLAVTNRRSLGQDYARTLREWRDNFNGNWSTINAQGFDETFRRMWEFYLAYCEAGFKTGYIDVHQIQMSRTNETGR